MAAEDTVAIVPSLQQLFLKFWFSVPGDDE